MWLLWAALAHAEEHRVTFLHVNDVYEVAPQRGWGGLAELQTLVQIERAKDPEAIFTFGGDLLSPSVLSSFTQGQPMIALMNELELDVAVIGNHELDFGPHVAAQRIGESRFPWLGANVVGGDGQPALGLVATTTMRRNGVDIGFVGVLTAELGVVKTSGDLSLTDPVEAVRAAVAAFEAQGITLVVALTHLDFEEDLVLVHAVPELDVVLGGHDHEPMTLIEGSTLIHKSGSDAHWLGVVSLTVDPEANTVVPSWRMIANHETPPAPEIQVKVAAYERQIDAKLALPIGKTKVVLDSRRYKVRTEETEIGNLVTDALRARLSADVAFTNGGGIRGDRTYDKGASLTARDVVAELPFANTATLLEVQGAQLQQVLEHAVSGVAEKEGRFLQVSGLTFTYDPAAPVGKRVRSVTVGADPLDPAKTYRVATSDYLADGGDGFTVLQGAKVLDASGELLATIVIAAIQRDKKVAPRLEGRIQTTTGG
jgi:5'-nucleotidase / UDP-sugar diphosphatase